MDSEKAEEEGEESGVLAGLRVEDRQSFSCDRIPAVVVVPPRPVSLRILAAENLRDSRFRSSDHAPSHPRARRQRTQFTPTHSLVIATDKRAPQGRGDIIQFREWAVNKGSVMAAKVRRNADPGVVNGRLGLKH